MTIASAALLLFLVMDPLGNIPFFVASLRLVEPRRQNRVVVRELLIALGVMLVFLFLGKPMLDVMRISEPALTISGGVILFLIAVRMVFPARGGGHEEFEGEPFIVPLAIPYVAGPSILATELLLMSREPARFMDWLAAIFIAWAGTAAILLMATRIRTLLGRRGLIAVERLMGMVLVTVAVQMFLTGVERYIAQLQKGG